MTVIDELHKNIILFDWLSVTSRIDSPFGMIDMLGLGELNFQSMGGFYNYRDRLYYDGIGVHYNGRGENMGVLLEMSGQGCRNFETFGHGDWYRLFGVFTGAESESYNVTRLDAAYDDHEGLLDIGKIAGLVRRQRYIAKARGWETVYSSKGISAYVGSQKSDTLIRFYDKAAERGYTDRHWVRCELQLRRGRAVNFIRAIGDSIGNAYMGVLNNYLRFVDYDSSDSNKRRWPVSSWWKRFTGNAGKISIYTKKDIEYNLARVEAYIMKQCGNSIDVYLQCMGLDYFLTKLKERDTYLQRHQKELIERYKAEVDGDFGDVYFEKRLSHETVPSH